MSPFTRIPLILAASWAAVMLPALAHAQNPNAGEAGRPTFHDERRWVPKAQPAPGATAAAKNSAQPAAATTTEPVVKKAGACAAPSVKPMPLDAGRMRVTVMSGCRTGQTVVWTYGGAEFQAILDNAGRAEFTVDAFAGTATPVELKFTDETIVSLPVEARDLDKVSKVAVIWRAPVNLDLHAFEYAALHGQPGHIHAAAPSSPAAAREWIEKSARGHGFLSTHSSADAARDRLEVYTFLHKDGQMSGLVQTAVDYETRGEKPEGASCGKGPNAEVAFRIVSLSRSGQINREAGIIAAAECGRALSPAARLNPGVMPTIRIKH